MNIIRPQEKLFQFPSWSHLEYSMEYLNLFNTVEKFVSEHLHFFDLKLIYHLTYGYPLSSTIIFLNKIDVMLKI